MLELPKIIIWVIAWIVTTLVMCSCTSMFFSVGPKEPFQSLPSAARDIILPKLDEAIGALNRKRVTVTSETMMPVAEETMIVSQYYYMNKKDPDTGSKVNNFYVIDSKKFAKLAAEYQIANSLLRDIRRDFPLIFAKILGK